MHDKDLITGFERYLLTERRVSRNTFDAYTSDLAQFIEYLTTQHVTLGALKEVMIKAFLKHLIEKLSFIQTELFTRAKKRLENMKVVQHNLDAIITASEWSLIQTGFCGSRDCEDELKKSKLSVRCLIAEKLCEVCGICQKPSVTDCIVARSY